MLEIFIVSDSYFEKCQHYHYAYFSREDFEHSAIENPDGHVITRDAESGEATGSMSYAAVREMIETKTEPCPKTPPKKGEQPFDRK